MTVSSTVQDGASIRLQMRNVKQAASMGVIIRNSLVLPGLTTTRILSKWRSIVTKNRLAKHANPG